MVRKTKVFSVFKNFKKIHAQVRILSYEYMTPLVHLAIIYKKTM